MHLVCLTTPPCTSPDPTLALAHIESVESSNHGLAWSSGLGADPRAAPRRMFCELAPEDVIGKPADLSCAKVEREWNRRNTRWKRPRGGLGHNENSTRMMLLREYTLREFWEIFVDDRPFGADACFKLVNLLRNDDNGRDPRMGGRREEGGIHIRRKHVDLHQKRG